MSALGEYYRAQAAKDMAETQNAQQQQGLVRQQILGYDDAAAAQQQLQHAQAAQIIAQTAAIRNAPDPNAAYTAAITKSYADNAGTMASANQANASARSVNSATDVYDRENRQLGTPVPTPMRNTSGFSVAAPNAPARDITSSYRAMPPASPPVQTPAVPYIAPITPPAPAPVAPASYPGAMDSSMFDPTKLYMFGTNQYAAGTADAGKESKGSKDSGGKSKGSPNAKAGQPALPPDTVPAMLSPGEAVLNKEAAEHMGRGAIAHLNQLGLMKMAMKQQAPSATEGMGGSPPVGTASAAPQTQPVLHAAAGDADVINNAQMQNGGFVGLGSGFGFGMFDGSPAGSGPASDSDIAMSRANAAPMSQPITSNLSNNGFQPVNSNSGFETLTPNHFAMGTPQVLDAPSAKEMKQTADNKQPAKGGMMGNGNGVLAMLQGMGVQHYAAGVEEVMPMNAQWEGLDPAPVGGMPPASKSAQHYAKGAAKVKSKAGKGQMMPPPASAIAPPQVPNAPGALPPNGGTAPSGPSVPSMPAMLQNSTLPS